MNRKRNVSYLKPEDPEFLKIMKRQAGYDDRNHKFDNAEDDFVDDGDSELPQVVVLKHGDLTAEEVEVEKKKIEQRVAETKADLNQRVIFKSKQGTRKTKSSKNENNKSKSSEKTSKLLSFDLEGDDVDD